MKTLSRWLGLLLLAAPVTGCDEGLDEAPGQEVFFEVNHANGAWGSQYKGFLIDKDGHIRKYNDAGMASGLKGSMPLTSRELDEKLAAMVLAPETIASGDLNTWVSRIGAIADTAYSKPVRAGADAGITRYYAYRYDQAKAQYTAVLLRQSGDELIDSRDEAALQIADWLKGVSGKIY
ncbi:hypothetical protein [Dyadobacter sandarakinus]|uniref:Uncharacterized protein n=1 Tax=Dyadobacter sandarakinus TaxID=2747268 RepID=A0ABX7I1F7_9BACT|nr:hypothetical protein [Dyadobacter sandarakinus]QRQ99905.1 hypothetical protein HWI92_02715 [Dyadobacter sandarakinus]